MEYKRIAYLMFQRYTQQITAEEEQELKVWLESDPTHKEQMHRMMDSDEIRKRFELRQHFDREKAWQTVRSQMTSSHKKIALWGRRMWQYAAVFLLLIGISSGITYYVLGLREMSGSIAQMQVPILAPDNEVILYQNGRHNVLEGNRYSLERQQPLSGSASDESVQLPLHEILPDDTTEIIVPKGKNFSLVLEDQTVVHLNSDSRLVFPTHFDDSERVVLLKSGEAFFEVTPDAMRPFNVHLANSKITVLGTCFNVSAYKDEAYVYTTLVEGKVKFSDANQREYMLRPSVQSCMNVTTGETQLRTVDTFLCTAWMDGKFVFRSKDIPSIMRQLQRWYDVDVRYEVKHTPKELRGAISRNMSLQQVLEILEETSGLTFELQGRTVIVSK